MAASGGAYYWGGTLDLSNNAAPDTSNPNIIDALDALIAANVDVYYDQ